MIGVSCSYDTIRFDISCSSHLTIAIARHYNIIYTQDVNWASEQCVQNCIENDLDHLSCGGRKKLSSIEVFDTPQDCCFGMLSFLSLSACIKTCPYEYDPEMNYKEYDLVRINRQVWQCKEWPRDEYCNLFAPNYKHISDGTPNVVHDMSSDLGWEVIGICDENGFRTAITNEDASQKEAPMGDSRTNVASDGSETDSIQWMTYQQQKQQRYERKKEKKQMQKLIRQKHENAATASSLHTGEKTDSDSSNSGAQSNKSTTEQGYILGATDDAHIYKAYPNRNANLPKLIIDNSRSAYEYDDDIETIIKFDISNIDIINMNEAILQLVAIDHDCYEELNINAVYSTKDWDENEVSWNAAPQKLAPTWSQPILPEYDYLPKHEWFNVDVTNAIIWSLYYEQLHYITFRISIIGYAGTGDNPTTSRCIIASKEYQEGRYWPSLEIRLGSNSSSSGNKQAENLLGDEDLDFHNKDSEYYQDEGYPQWDGISSSNKNLLGDEEFDFHNKDSGPPQWDGKLPTQPQYVHKEWEPITRPLSEEWHVDYSLGLEGQCVKNCKKKSDPNCGGGAAINEWWVDLYDSPQECCQQMLWWMSMRQCVPDYDG